MLKWSNGIIASLFLASVCAQAQAPLISVNPTREFGQVKLQTPATSVAPNMVEGREVYNPYSIAFDNSVTPPIIYVADTFNNRVLAWRNSAAITGGKTEPPVADLVIGQRDMTSTIAQGPPPCHSGGLTSGLSLPIAVAVDGAGNLYVADGGNNRILRFPSPFQQSSSPLQPDIVIGQPTPSQGCQNNQATGSPTAQYLYLSNNSNIFPSGLALDGQGNLWVTDGGNNRVLEFAASSLTPNTNQPTAIAVLGQTDFTHNTTPQYPNNTPTTLSVLYQPSSLTFDSKGRLYIADGYGRVLEYSTVVSGATASRVLGVTPTPSQGQPAPTFPNAYSLGQQSASGSIIAPLCVFTDGSNIYVCDTGANRIVQYGPPENWAAAGTTAPSPAWSNVYGQGNASSGTANGGAVTPSGAPVTFSSPSGGAFDAASSEVWIADTNNNRVIAFAPPATTATHLLGQIDFSYSAANLIEGKEVFFSSGTARAGIAVDQNSNPPHLYVSDSFNHRILGFYDARKVTAETSATCASAGSECKADLVIGQANGGDFYENLINYPTGKTTTPSANSLYLPAGLVVDPQGNLYVSDSGNGRVLRFPAPFAQSGCAPPATSSCLPQANLVLGSPSLTSSRNPSVTSVNLATPIGLALFSDGSLAVADGAQNRVLIFSKPSGGDFANGQAAAYVLGQPDFNTSTSGNTASQMNAPLGVAADAAGRLYVADTSNNRVLIFNNGRAASQGLSAQTVVTGFNAPYSIALNDSVSNFWVASTNNSQLISFPGLDGPNGSVWLTGATTNTSLASEVAGSTQPIAIALDASGSLVVAEGANRITFYYPLMVFRNAANYNTQGLAPGMIAILGRPVVNFSLQPAAASNFPLPPTLGDVQVLFNGNPAPLIKVNPTGSDQAVYFIVPMGAPVSGNADVEVVQASTQQVLGVGSFPMVPANPGFFTANSAGTGAVAAVNPDGSANSPSNPIQRGQTIQLFLTGQGYVPNAPADGQPPAYGSTIPTPSLPQVAISPGPSGFLPASAIEYSGLAPGLPGLWQLNITIPTSVPPGTSSIALIMQGVKSNIGGNPTNQSNGLPGGDVSPITTTISVKQ